MCSAIHIEVSAQERRPADGARKRLHPSPDPGRRRPLQRARPARGGAPRDQAGAHALAAEAAHFEELSALAVAPSRDRRHRRRARPHRRRRRLAQRAAEGGWCRPRFDEQACFEVEAGRHPVVEDALKASGARFVANDCRSSNDRLWLVTGPNMGGKSTFLRQNALIILLAQAGSYVPATRRQGRPRRPPVQPGRRLGQSRPRPLDLHGRNGRDRRDPRPGERRKASSSSTRSAAAPRPMTGSPSPGRWSRRSTTGRNAAACSRPIITS